MKKYLIIPALLMFVASFAGAHHAAVNIEANKVIVKVGDDHHKMGKLMKCMLLLQRTKTLKKQRC